MPHIPGIKSGLTQAIVRANTGRLFIASIALAIMPLTNNTMSRSTVNTT